MVTGYSLVDMEHFQNLIQSAGNRKACRRPISVMSLLKDAIKSKA